jgi:hypothetical protein
VPVEVLAEEDVVRIAIALAALAGAAVLGGCGGGRSGWSDAACRREARWAAQRADRMLFHYGGGSVYPADVSYLGFKGSLDRFLEGRCPEERLGQALTRRMTPGERKTLVRLLPRKQARVVRDALAAA